MTKGVESADRENGFLNRNKRTHQTMMSEVGVVVVDPKKDEVSGSSTQ
jgi:hypothetical protein